MEPEFAYTFDQFRAMHPDGMEPSDSTIRRRMKDGTLPQSKRSRVYHCDLAGYFKLTDAQVDALVRRSGERVPA